MLKFLFAHVPVPALAMLVRIRVQSWFGLRFDLISSDLVQKNINQMALNSQIRHC
jgi:hypothetical protein